MNISNKTLANHIHNLLRQRVKLNLKAGNLENISVSFSRTELREITGAGRIENKTIETMMEKLANYGYTVNGTSASEDFTIVVNVRNLLSKFESLDELSHLNSEHSQLLFPRPPVRPHKA